MISSRYKLVTGTSAVGIKNASSPPTSAVSLKRSSSNFGSCPVPVIEERLTMGDHGLDVAILASGIETEADQRALHSGNVSGEHCEFRVPAIWMHEWNLYIPSFSASNMVLKRLKIEGGWGAPGADYLVVGFIAAVWCA